MMFLKAYSKGFNDQAGSIVVHMLAAYCGFVTVWTLGKPSAMKKEGTCPISDLIAFIGVVFPWIDWLSFVAAWISAGSAKWDAALTETVLALIGSCVNALILPAVL